MKKVLGVLLMTVLIIGCGSKESVGQKEVSSIPTQNHDYLKDGVQYLQQAQPREAIKSLDQAIRQNPRDSRPYMVLGETYIRLNQYDRAIDTFSAASRVAPTEGRVYYLLALSYGLSGDKEQAKVNAEKSVLIFQRNKDGENLKKSLALLKGLVDSQPVVKK